MFLLKKIFNLSFGCFFPFSCHLCSKETPVFDIICPDCLKKIEENLTSPELIDDVECEFPIYSFSHYNSFIADAIRIIKYRPSQKLLKVLVGKTEGLSGSLFSSNDILVPVPMHQEREFKRGFNQAAMIAKIISERHKTFFSSALIRTTNTRPQADCDQSERLKNLDNKIKVHPQLIVSEFCDKNIVIVDDVATTGTTLQKCYEQLILLRPKSIKAVVLSHSFKRELG